CDDSVSLAKIKRKLDEGNHSNVDPELLIKLQKMVNYQSTDKMEISALIHDDIFKVLPVDLVVEILRKNYKPIGPIDNKLFNNYVLNQSMRDLQSINKKFIAYDCELIDFMDSDMPLSDLKNIDLSKFGYYKDKEGNITKNQYECFGCILNTLNRNNMSKVGHWVALFGDFRKNNATIEYYNSSGNGAPKRLNEYLSQLANKYEKINDMPCKFINA